MFNVYGCDLILKSNNEEICKIKEIENLHIKEGKLYSFDIKKLETKKINSKFSGVENSQIEMQQGQNTIAYFENNQRLLINNTLPPHIRGNTTFINIEDKI
ncbi:MAG: hypothetical protein OQK82_08080 [Candidatus Pacearchaeota archaeon]|nr:hypothetical protein [Candidatus Pacearchaeota archaeon]